jgi:hypothetical protein
VHAWPEVYLDGAGWTMFEPTPGRFDPSPNNATGTGDDAPSDPGQTTDSTTPTTTPVPTTAAGGDGARDPRDALAQVSAQAPESDDTRTPMLRRAADVLFLDHPARSLGILLVAAMMLSLVGAAGVVVVKAWRRRKRRTASDARARVEGAWVETTDRLVEAGISTDAALTPTEFALRRAAAQGAGSAGGALVQLAHLVTEAMYSPDMPSDDSAGRAWDHADEIASTGACCATVTEVATASSSASDAGLDARPTRSDSTCHSGSAARSEVSSASRATNASRSAVKARTSDSTCSAKQSTATNSASWPDRSASRI